MILYGPIRQGLHFHGTLMGRKINNSQEGSSYRHGIPDLSWSGVVERVTRIELALSAWEADVLPLNYTRAEEHVDTGPALRASGSSRHRIGVQGLGHRLLMVPAASPHGASPNTAARSGAPAECRSGGVPATSSISRVSA